MSLKLSGQQAKELNRALRRAFPILHLLEDAFRIPPHMAPADADSAYSPQLLAQLTRAIIDRHRAAVTDTTQPISAATIESELGSYDTVLA